MLALTLTLLTLLGGSLVAQNRLPSATPPDPATMIEIDGSKNPEMVPEWNAWRNAFRLIHQTEHLRADLLKKFTEKEGALLTTEAAASFQNDSEFEASRAKLWTKVMQDQQNCLQKEPDEPKRKACFKEKWNGLLKTFPEQELAYRQRILDARNRVLQAFQGNPESQMAIAQWVEMQKAGVKIHLAKSELSNFRKPQ